MHRSISKMLLLTIIAAAIRHGAMAQSSIGTGIAFSRSNMKINNVLLNGTWDFRFKLWDAANEGSQVGPILTKPDLNISNGVLPPQALDFGDGAFNGMSLWIETRARQGNQPFAPVGARQRFWAVPYALALPGLRTTQGLDSPNIVGGYIGNVIGNDVDGAVVAGGGAAGAINGVYADLGVVGGGYENFVSGHAAVVGGGYSNDASADWATVGGGDSNAATGVTSTVAGGKGNQASEVTAAIGGGDSNVASGSTSVIAGGYFNTTGGNAAAVGGGSGNVANGVAATVPGGKANQALANYTFAAGRRAIAGFEGAFVWADSTDDDFYASGTNIFTARCSGGVSFYTSADLSTGVAAFGGSGSWSTLSDRAVKENIKDINPRDILTQVCAMPIKNWNYIAQDDAVRHIGPMAQDFRAAFGIGEDDRHISAVDADGVALAAIQGLHQIVQDKDAVIRRQGNEISDLRHRLSDLETAMRNFVSQRPMQ